MENLTTNDAAKKIKIYLQQDNLRPYFLISDNAAKFNEIKKLLGKDFEPVYLSEICMGDFFLDSDLFFERLQTFESNALIFGLGEYVYFTGDENILRRLQDSNFNHKVIFFCRGISNLLERLAAEDIKFRTNNLCKVAGNVIFSVTKYRPDMKIETDADNFGEFLKLVEGGKFNLTLKTFLPLENVKSVENFYDAVKIQNPNLKISADALNAEQWQEYFFDDNCKGYALEHWRTFAAGFKNQIADSYLKYVFSISKTYEDYQRNLFFALLEIKDEKTFNEFYAKRKAAVKNISAQFVSEYLVRLKDFSNAVKYLTDNTAAERYAMIQAVQGKEKILEILKKNFPALEDYLADYNFDDAEITEYFRQYKKIKVCNVDDENFKNQVQKFSIERPYNKFKTRREILESADQNAKLYWLDALGVEFLSYIEARAKFLGLFVKIKVARADLPTLTSQNKNFYEEWRGEKFDKNSQLDDLKHSQENFDAAGKCSAPIYIDNELQIIDAALEEIKISLTQNDTEKIILTSDHGASRLAVMYGREINYRMITGGEHSGRCCPVNEIDEKPPCATEENGYWVLANYERFSGGRLSSIEVHGGATLEEILVPVIEISLLGAKIKTKNFSKEKISAPLKKVDEGFEFFE